MSARFLASKRVKQRYTYSRCLRHQHRIGQISE